jgi:hypothetical protein
VDARILLEGLRSEYQAAALADEITRESSGNPSADHENEVLVFAPG